MHCVPLIYSATLVPAPSCSWVPCKEVINNFAHLQTYMVISRVCWFIRCKLISSPRANFACDGVAKNLFYKGRKILMCVTYTTIYKVIEYRSGIYDCVKCVMYCTVYIQCLYRHAGGKYFHFVSACKHMTAKSICYNAEARRVTSPTQYKHSTQIASIF